MVCTSLNPACCFLCLRCVSDCPQLVVRIDGDLHPSMLWKLILRQPSNQSRTKSMEAEFKQTTYLSTCDFPVADLGSSVCPWSTVGGCFQDNRLASPRCCSRSFQWMAPKILQGSGPSAQVGAAQVRGEDVRGDSLERNEESSACFGVWGWMANRGVVEIRGVLGSPQRHTFLLKVDPNLY